jgi:hypothetical protein
MAEYPFNLEKIKSDPDAILEMLKTLFDRVQFLENKFLVKEAETKKYTDRGGSKKGKSGLTWSKDKPVTIINNYVNECLNCGKKAPEKDQKISYTKRITEMPIPAQIELQEHYLYKYHCSDCDKTTQAADPTVQGTSLGINFLTFLTTARYLTGSSFENIAQLIAVNTGVKPSQTSLNRGLARVCTILEPIAEEMAHTVMNSDWIKIDSTEHLLVEQRKGKSNGSKRIWVWVFASPEAAYFSVDFTRGNNALQDALEFRDNELEPPISISDCHQDFMKIFHTKQLCWNNLLQDTEELKNLSDEGRILNEGLHDLFEQINEIRTALLNKKPVRGASEAVIDRIRSDMDELLDIDTDLEEILAVKTHLAKFGEHYLTGLTHVNIPLTNIRAKRLLETVVLHRANGKPLRSKQAMKQYSILLTVLSTWTMNDIALQEKLRETITKQVSKPHLIG